MLRAFCIWLSRTPISEAFQDWRWFVPIVQTLHILSIAVLLTAVYFIGLALLGYSPVRQPLAGLAAGTMPWIWRALAVLSITGLLLIITEPARELLNGAFRTKMLIVVALVLLLRFIQIRLRASPHHWELSAGRRLAARALGAAALLMGAALVIAGRWIAYV